MSAGCCHPTRRPDGGDENDHAHDAAAFDGASPAFRRALWAVIAINAAMFAVEMLAGTAAESKALHADALDFLGDSATYALSLAVIGRAVAVRSAAALAKSLSLVAFALAVLGTTIWRIVAGSAPEPAVMGAVGVLALAANLGSAALLYRFREGDANVRSVWLCSRNDAIGNLAVLAAAGLVAATATPWPDLIVALGMATLFLHTAASIARQALSERQRHRTQGSATPA